MYTLRAATEADIEQMRQIYLPYVTDTTVTFEYDPPELAEFQARFHRISLRYPWIVCEMAGIVIGYAYADVCFSTRAAYQWNADLSIYLRPDCAHDGAGTLLYQGLISLLAYMGFRHVYALITGENAISLSFHEKMDFQCEGKMSRSGHKFGRWIDVYWYEKTITPLTAPTQPPLRFSEIPKSKVTEILKDASNQPISVSKKG